MVTDTIGAKKANLICWHVSCISRPSLGQIESQSTKESVDSAPSIKQSLSFLCSISCSPKFLARFPTLDKGEVASQPAFFMGAGLVGVITGRDKTSAPFLHVFASNSYLKKKIHETDLIKRHDELSPVPEHSLDCSEYPISNRRRIALIN